jgi:hypothetical protein
VAEGQTAVGTVGATDPDAGDTLTYSLDASDAHAAFDIAANSGVLTFKTAPIFEIVNTYTVTVVVTDSGGLSSTIGVTVNVVAAAETQAQEESDADSYRATAIFVQGRVMVRWDSVPRAHYYIVHRNTQRFPGRFLATYFYDDNVQEDTTYEYRITAYDDKDNKLAEIAAITTN